jgi:hypothetical protein
MQITGKRKLFLITAVLALVLGGALWSWSAIGSSAQAARSAPDGYGIEWNVLSGAIGPMSSSSYRMQGTMGQTMAGWFSGPTYKVHAGFWQNFSYRVFLPVMLKNMS